VVEEKKAWEEMCDMKKEGAGAGGREG